ncbi:MAG: iron-sulfur cluster assembly protein [Steroidobacteraceae bacterium]|jgi:metal-sulfur cluster biosynthetic enzyme|nr:iron-sulfur cluster assembly protein [Steroidobacteraceae bacterium]
MAPILTEDMRRIRDALASVLDPCHALSDHPLGILDLGLVNEVSRRGDVIEVRMTLTEPTCVFAHRIVTEIEDLAPTLPGVARIEVVFDHLPIWEPARMSERARRVFADRRAAFAPTFRNVPIAVSRAAGVQDGEVP